jgi:hypothetical protein
MAEVSVANMEVLNALGKQAEISERTAQVACHSADQDPDRALNRPNQNPARVRCGLLAVTVLY